MSEVDLDQYLGTPDMHFNANAQNWYFEFTGIKKPDTDMPFEIFIAAVHQLYLFYLANRDKPFACLNEVKKLPLTLGLDDKATLVVVDRLLGVLSNHAEHPGFMLPLMQLVDHRHNLSPYTDDPEIMDHRWEFDFDELKELLDNLNSPKEKIVHIINTVTDFQQKIHLMDELTQHYYLDTRFLEKCLAEVQRIKLLNALEEPAGPTAAPVQTGLSLEEKKNLVRKYLHFFNGLNYAQQPIMESNDYEALLSYVDAFLADEKVPQLRALPQLGLTNEFIRYTFYLLHKKLYGTRQIRPEMIAFIHTVFSQFSGTSPATTKTKFSVVPPHYTDDAKYRAR